MGKTCLLSRYLNNTLPKSYDPAIKSLSMKDGSSIKAQIWDTSSLERFKALTVAHFRKALGFLIVYDVTNRSSFDKAQNWLQMILDQAKEEVCFMLVGNKVDLVEEDQEKRQLT